MLYDILRAIFWGVIGIIILGAIIGSILRINLAFEITNYGLRHTIERIWDGPQNR
jgi:hypothetical protein